MIHSDSKGRAPKLGSLSEASPFISKLRKPDFPEVAYVGIALATLPQISNSTWEGFAKCCLNTFFFPSSTCIEG